MIRQAQLTALGDRPLPAYDGRSRTPPRGYLRLFRWFVVLCAFSLPGAGGGLLAQELGHGCLFWAHWRVEAWGGSQDGVACWLQGEAGRLRVDTAIGSPNDVRDGLPARIWQRDGQGYTLAASGPGSATLQPWGRRWRPAPALLAADSRLLALAAVCGAKLPTDGEPWRTLPRPADPQRRQRPRWLRGQRHDHAALRVQIEVPDLDQGPAGETSRDQGVRRSEFRDRMRRWGHGGGGGPEMLSLQWAEDPADSGTVLRVQSSRRLGSLVIGTVHSRAVRYPDPEVFLPLWSLSDLDVGAPGRQAEAAGCPDPCLQ